MIELSFSRPPPSVNNLFVNGRKGRFPSAEYKQWKTEIGWEIAQQRQKPIPGPVRVILTFEPGQTDLDNLLKGSLDALVAHKLIEGDSPKYVKWLSVAFDDKLKGARVKVQSL